MTWGWDGAGGGWWMMGIGGLFWLLVLGLTVWLVLRATGGRDVAPRGESAEELLRRRFAAGEIDAEEYERRLEVLRRR